MGIRLSSSPLRTTAASGYVGRMPRRREPTEFVEMFGAVKRRITAAASHAYAEADLGSLQAKLLRHIGLRGHSSQAELARGTDSHPTLIGRALETLIDRGLVRR